MRIKVYGGTIQERHLCDECQHARSRTESGKRRYFCSMAPDPKGPVTECNLYVDRIETKTLTELEAAAWFLDIDELGKLSYSTPADRKQPRRRRIRRTRAVDADFVETSPNSKPN